MPVIFPLLQPFMTALHTVVLGEFVMVRVQHFFFLVFDTSPGICPVVAVWLPMA